MRIAKRLQAFSCLALMLILTLLSACGNDSSSSDDIPPALALSSGTTSFHLKAGEAGASKSVLLDTNNGSAPAFSISAIDNVSAPWLTAVESLGGINAPAEIQITVDTVGLGLASNVIHSENVSFSADGFQSTSLKVMLSIDLYDIMVSISSDRTDPNPLEGATLKDDAYIFVSPNQDIKVVNFFYDTDDLTTTPYQIEDEIYYDFETTIDENPDLLARPFDTTTQAEGAHFIIVQIAHPDGSISTLRSDFTIDNIP